MTQISKLLSMSVVGLLVVGCGRPSNVPHMQKDAKQIAVNALPVVEVLERRIAQIQLRGRSLPPTTPGYQLASTTIGAATNTVTGLKADLTAQPTKIDAAAKLGVDDLLRHSDELRAKIRADLTVATANISTVENWIAQAEYQGKSATAPSATPPTPPAH